MKLSEYEKTILVWGIDLIVGFAFTQFSHNLFLLLILWIFIPFHGIIYMLRFSLPTRKFNPLEIIWSIPLILGLIVTILQEFNVVHTNYQPQILWIFLCGIIMALTGIILQHIEFTYLGFGWIGMGILCTIFNASPLLAGLVLGLPLIYKQVIKYLEWKFTGQQTVFKYDSLGNNSGVIN